MVLDEPSKPIEAVKLLGPVVVLGEIAEDLLHHVLCVLDGSQLLL